MGKPDFKISDTLKATNEGIERALEKLNQVMLAMMLLLLFGQY